MNAKTCKKIRQAIRANGVDPKVVMYVCTKNNRTTALCAPTSGRGIYRKAKRNFGG